jgi:membrane protein implicated in regulation of membrane protease activity
MYLRNALLPVLALLVWGGAALVIAVAVPPSGAKPWLQAATIVGLFATFLWLAGRRLFRRTGGR